MNREQQMVSEFHQAFDALQSLTPTVIDSDTRTLRRTLLHEELEELDEAMTADQLPAIAKELADLLYVVYGTDVSYGIDLGPVFREVHQSNMTKVGGTRRDDGKWIKPASYSPADIAPILEAQRRRQQSPHDTPRSYPARQQTILQDPSTPYWVRQLLTDLAQKDPVDVLHALDVMRDLMQRCVDELFHHHLAQAMPERITQTSGHDTL